VREQDKYIGYGWKCKDGNTWLGTGTYMEGIPGILKGETSGMNTVHGLLNTPDIY